jgi:TonB-linked SusC/RagA family outer membrane protein
MRKILHLWRIVLGFTLFCGVVDSSTAFARPTPAGLRKHPFDWSLSGKVSSPTGEPLQGVSVLLKASKKGTATDNDGTFVLQVPERSGVLVFSSSGYAPQEVAFSGPGPINVTLQIVNKSMSEVVVVGYGTQKRTSITGSVTAISGKELLQAPTTNVTNALAGRLPGLIAVQGSGRPGAGSFLSIRGFSTLGGAYANAPLVVVDGIVRDNALDQIDPNQVASISILKDASAAAVYGSRAANGVILITTKRGQAGKPTFSYNGFVGTQDPTVYPKMMNPFEYVSTFNEALKNEGKQPRFSAQQLEDYKAGRAGTDYYALTFRNRSLQTQHNINVSGGSEAVKYFFSGGYTNQQGMFEAINYQNYSLRSNVDAKINQNLTISGDFDANSRSFNNSGYTAEQIFAEVIASSPDKNVYNPDGSLNYQASYSPEYPKAGYGKNRVNLLQTTLSFKQELPFLRGLSFSGKGSYGKEYSNNKTYRTAIVSYHGSYSGAKAYWGGGPSNQPTLTQSFSEYNTLYYSLNLNYNRTFGDHEVSALALWEQFGATGNNFGATRNFFPATGLDELNFGGQQQQQANGSSFDDARRSYVVRGNYAYKQRYFLEGSFRVDGSVAFPTAKKYGFFPAVSAGWRISEESFMRDNAGLAFIDNLKLRASYGKVGNDRNVYNGRIPTFQYLQAYNLAGTVIQGNNPLTTIRPGVFPNPNITWENAAITNVGLDGTFWRSKLQVTVDVFRKRTSDILITRSRSTPSTFGASLPAENFAVVDNKGFEVALTHNNRVGALSFYVRLNGTYARNKVINIDEPAGKADYLVQTGRPLGFIAGYQSLGFFQSEEDILKSPKQFNGGQKPGDVKYADVNGDGKVDNNDQTIISYDNNIPKVTGGLNIGGTFKGFDFSLLFQGAAKAKILLDRSARQFFVNSAENNFRELLDYWTPQNPNAKYPRPLIGAKENNYTSDLYLRNASYIRFRSVDVGYTLPKALLDRIHVQRLRVYFSGANLFVLDKNLMFDPEAEAASGSYYPQQRTLNLGLNLTF